MKRLNLGCGDKYFEGWVNLDNNPTIKADIYHDVEKGLPFMDNEFDYVYLDNSLEHFKNFELIMDELYRICKPNALIEIYVPHYSASVALKHPTHYRYFGIGTFNIYSEETPLAGERYGNTKSRFKVIKQEMTFLTHQSQNFSWAIPFTKPLDWFCNAFGFTWKLFWEKFALFGWEEIHYILQVVKK